MSTYTTQLRWIVEQYTYDNADKTLSERINLALPKLFDFDYPIWQEGYRTTLERKIVMHYINKEIGLETVALFKLYLEERLNLIMPYYNSLYETVAKSYDYLVDIDYTETYTGKTTSNDTTSLTDDISVDDTHTITNSSDTTAQKKTVTSGDTTLTLNTQHTEDNTHLNTLNTTAKNTLDTTAKNTLNTTNMQMHKGTDTNSGTSKQERNLTDATTYSESGNNLSSDTPQANYARLDYATNLQDYSKSGNNTLKQTGTDTRTDDFDTTYNSTLQTTDSGNTMLTNTGTTTLSNTGTTNLEDAISAKNTGTEKTSISNTDTTNDTINVSNNGSDNRKMTEGKTSQGTANKNGTNDYTITRQGLNGSRSQTQLLIDYRKSLINIDMLIINELSDLFMRIY